MVVVLAAAALAALAFITAALWLTSASIAKKARLRLPPGPRRWPIVGNLLQLGRLPHRDMAAMCRMYGPLVYLRLGHVDAVTTDDPGIIREILQRQDDVFSSRPTTVAATHLAYGGGDVALAAMGPKWKHMRRICMEHLLTCRRLDSFEAQRRDEAHLMVQSVLSSAAGGRPVNLRDVLSCFSMNNVTRMLLGKRFFGGGPQNANDFMHVTHELFHLLGLIYVGDYLPFWRRFDPTGLERRMRRVERRMDAFHSAIIREHRMCARPQQDFVDVLLSLRGEGDKSCLDDTDVKAIVQDMIAAATDTSAVTSEWAMAEVIRNGSVMKKAQAELDKVVGHNRVVEEFDLAELTYVRCIVRETFRMHPAGPFLIPHESIRQTKVAGYDIPAGTRVFINTHALGRNPRIWEHVDEFRPERHECGDNERVEISHGPDFKILPFGSGKRRCPGAPLGTCFVLLALARLIHSFDWEAVPEERGESRMDMSEVYGMTMPRAKPLFAIAKPRLSPHLYNS